MVSTRQMATSGSNGSGHTSNNNSSNHSHNNNSTATVAAAALESARLSVVTRQTSSNYVLVNCSTIPPTQRSLTQVAGIGNGVGGSGALTRQQHNHNHNSQSAHTPAAAKANAANTSANSSNMATTAAPQLLDMPVEIFSKICSYVGYRKVGQLRVVSPKMNNVCMDILNSTFSRLINQTFHRFHAIKANMPRRESARRNHPLACECDIIETCYMRLSLLQMTFGKHIERGHCCFFPGAILDEVYNILNYVRNTPRLERPYRVTDELFDLSTMAMEYFKDRIEPTLPDIAYFNKDYFKLPTNTKRPSLVTSADHADNSSSIPSPPQSNMVLRKGIRKIKQGMKIYNNQLSVLRSELRTCKRKSAEQSKQIAEQQKLLAEQQKQTLEYANRLDENDKKNEEMSRKFSTLLQELNKCKTELQYWRSKSPAIPTCTTCGQKVVPVLPPEDYQALINQGVKPEDIILNLTDDFDAESDVSMHEPSTETPVSEFAFPDQSTTAKLLAVNPVTKTAIQPNRTHSATSNPCNSNGNGNNACAGHCNCNSVSTAAELTTVTYNADSKPSEMMNRMHYVRGNNIIRTTANATSSCHTTNMHPGHIAKLTPNKSHPAATVSSNKSAAFLPTVAAQAATIFNNENVNCTKQNFGSKSHKGVIVSPAMLMVTRTQQEQVAVAEDLNRNVSVEIGGAGDAAASAAVPVINTRSSSVNTGNAVDAGCANDTVAASSAAAVAVAAAVVAVEDVVSLQAITSHETKKARRVQKATRCLNGSGKRSK